MLKHFGTLYLFRVRICKVKGEETEFHEPNPASQDKTARTRLVIWGRVSMTPQHALRLIDQLS